MRKAQSKLLNGLVKSGYFVAIFAVMFALGFFSASHFMPVSESQAEEAGPRYANIATSGKVELAIDSTPAGVAKVGKDTLTVDTNAQTEYRLYISTVKNAAGSGLYPEDSGEQYVSPSDGQLADPIKLATNTWGFAQSRATNEDEAKTYTDKDADYENGQAVFVGVPEYGSEKLLYTNTDPTTESTNTLDVYYGMSASTALPAGSYSNTVVYTAIVDESNSGAPKMTVTPERQVGPLAGQKITITTDIYPDMEASNLGDIDVYIGDARCTNTVPTINADGAIQITCNVPKGQGERDVRVYLRKFSKKQVLSKGYNYWIPTDMGDFFSCTTYYDVGQGTRLRDERDEDTNGEDPIFTYYRVVRLKGGRCWMKDSLARKTKDTFYAGRWLDSDVLPGSSFTLADPSDSAWCTDENSSCYDKSLVAKNGDYGNYYNWYSATAGTGYYSRASGDAGSSICPTGWRLPTKSDYENMLAGYSSAAELTAMADFVLSGKRIGGTNEEQGVAGYYWSATSSEVGKAYALKVTDSTAELVSLEGNVGAAVRCIALSRTEDTMQNFTPPEGALVGDSKTLFDTRFTGKNTLGPPRPRYHVAKLKDGKWWMLREMEGIGEWNGPITLTPDDTDITSDFVLPKYSSSEQWCLDDTAECDNQIKQAEDSQRGYGDYQPKYSFTGEAYLYNWYTATAGAGTYEKASGNVTTSICPKGWTLPTGSSPSGDFATLSAAYGGPSTDTGSGQEAVVATLVAKPLPGFDYTGVHDSSYGAWNEVLLWSRTAKNNAQADYFNLVGGRLLTSGWWGNKFKGFGIRCIRKADSV